MSWRTSSGGSGSCCRRGASLGLGYGFRCGLPWQRADGLGRLLGSGLGLGLAAGAGLVGMWALAAEGLLAVGTGMGARLEDVPRGLGG